MRLQRLSLIFSNFVQYTPSFHGSVNASVADADVTSMPAIWSTLKLTKYTDFQFIIIIIIIIINEKINVAFSRRTARARNSHKKTQAAKTSCLTVQKKKYTVSPASVRLRHITDILGVGKTCLLG